MGKKKETDDSEDKARDAVVRGIVAALNQTIRRALEEGPVTHEDLTSALLNMMAYHGIRAGLELSEIIDVIARAYGSLWLEGVRPKHDQPTKKKR